MLKRIILAAALALAALTPPASAGPGDDYPCLAPPQLVGFEEVEPGVFCPVYYDPCTGATEVSCPTL